MKQNNLFLRIGFNTSIQLIGKILSVLLSLLTVYLLTRLLGKEGYGNFTLVFSYLSFFSILGDFGMQLVVVKELSNKKIDVDIIYGSYLWLKLVLIVVSTALSVLLLLFFPYSQMLKVGIVIGVVAVGIANLTGFGLTIFQSKVRLDLITLVDLFTKVFTVTFIVLSFIYKLNFYFVILSVLIGNILGLAITFFLLRDTFRLKTIIYKADRKYIKRIISLIVPIGLTSLFSLLYFKVDTIILSLFKTVADVGVYSLAYKILENLLMLWGFYMASVYPLLSNLKGEKKYKEFRDLYRSSFIIGLISSVMLLITSYIFSPLLVKIFGGESFIPSIVPFKILIFALPVLFINNLLYFHHLLNDRYYFLFKCMAMTLSINFLLNVIFVPQFGYIATSITTIVTEVFLMILMLTKFDLSILSYDREKN